MKRNCLPLAVVAWLAFACSPKGRAPFVEQTPPLPRVSGGQPLSLPVRIQDAGDPFFARPLVSDAAVSEPILTRNSTDPIVGPSLEETCRKLDPACNVLRDRFKDGANEVALLELEVPRDATQVWVLPCLRTGPAEWKTTRAWRLLTKSRPSAHPYHRRLGTIVETRWIALSYARALAFHIREREVDRSPRSVRVIHEPYGSHDDESGFTEHSTEVAKVAFLLFPESGGAKWEDTERFSVTEVAAKTLPERTEREPASPFPAPWVAQRRLCVRDDLVALCP
jgi:hypothetical protein